MPTDRPQVQLASPIGVADQVPVLVETFYTGKNTESASSGLDCEPVAFTPKGIIEMLDLRRPPCRETAAIGQSDGANKS